MAVTSTSSSKKHICVFAYEAWGHVRPMSSLCARIVKSSQAHLTFFIPASFYDRVDGELSRNFTEKPEQRSLIRLIPVENNSKDPLNTSTLDDAYVRYYRTLASGQSVTCHISATEFWALPPPTTVITDFFAKNLYESINQIGGKSVHKSIFFTGAAASLFFLFGPGNLGGRGDIRPKVKAEIARSGRSFTEVANEMALAVHGSVVHVPGLPPMFDYEYHPQKLTMQLGIAQMWLDTYDLMRMCDSLIVGTPECYEPQAVAGIRQWFAETARSVYVLGPWLPLERSSVAREKQSSAKSVEIEQFLASILESHGPNSLIYISFGTFFWPSEPERIWTLLDVIMEKNIPFIMSHASPSASVPDSVAQKVRAYGKGILSPWSPQQTILGHPATGWFVTHGGHGSVIESVSQGVPLIVWPYYGDQSLNAVHTSVNLDIAYELLEVRTGHGLKPRYRDGKTPENTLSAVRREARETLDKACGGDGARKRANVLRLKARVADAWATGGSSHRDLEAYVHTMV